MITKGIRTLVLGAAALFGALGAGAQAKESVTFSVAIDSIATKETLVLPNGTKTSAPISPGLYLVSRDKFVLFRPGRKASGTALERLAEDGDPEPLIRALSKRGAKGFVHNQGFTVTAKPGDRLHFAVMFAQSNDLFYAPREGSLALFDAKGRPVSGDFTAELVLWDAGTEVNQPPGVGADQAPRQAKPNTGADEHGVVRPVNDGFTYPATADVIRITITPKSVIAGDRH